MRRKSWWKSYPAAAAVKHQIEVHHRGGRLVTATGSAVLEAEGIATGLRIDLADLFGCECP
ncbi:MAG: hypothetical protein HYV26_17555 [Candidatus Hydrogenedentes bacterium]|nr:hypothetical protein [Candidatus Hydrogenedentota bacterium]